MKEDNSAEVSREKQQGAGEETGLANWCNKRHCKATDDESAKNRRMGDLSDPSDEPP